MPAVTLHRIGEHNRDSCLALRVLPTQEHLIATVEKSLRQAKGNPNLFPLAIYDANSRGLEQPTEPVVGFVMYEVVAGVGFVERLLIDQAWQGKGYGKAALKEVIRRLKLYPEVELVTTSHRRENSRMASLLKRLDFIPWATPFTQEDPDEVFMRLRTAEAEE